MTGIVRGINIGTNRDGIGTVVMLTCAINKADDLQTVEYMTRAGDNHLPTIGSIVAILGDEKNWKIAVASYDGLGIAPGLQNGERLLYSQGRASSIKIANDGSLIFNGEGDNLIGYTAAAAGFDTLVLDHNTHVHSGPGNPPSILSSASIAASKKDRLKTI